MIDGDVCAERRNRKRHGKPVIARRVGPPAPQPARPAQVKSVTELLDIGPQRLKSAHERADAIAFLHAELARSGDVQFPAKAGPGREGRNLVDEIWNLICSQ